MPVPLFLPPPPFLNCNRSRTTTLRNIAPTALASDSSKDNNVQFIKQRIEDLRKLVSSPTLPSLPISLFPSNSALPSLSALQRLVAISTFRALAPTPLDHLCPIPSRPHFDPILALNLATYAFRAYHDPPSSAYRETFITHIGHKYSIQTDFVYPSTEHIAARAAGVFLLKISTKLSGYITARINCATVRDLNTLRHVSLLRIDNPNNPPDDLLHLYFHPSTDRRLTTPSHNATLSLKSIVHTAFQTHRQASHPPLTIIFAPIHCESHRIDYFQESLLPAGLRLPFLLNNDQHVDLENQNHSIQVIVDVSFIPFPKSDRSDVRSDSYPPADEGEQYIGLEENWDVSEAFEALEDAIQEAADEQKEAESSLKSPERSRRDALALILRMQLPKQTMPAPTDWNRLAAAASSLIDQITVIPGSGKMLDVNASACLFVENQATDTEVWFFRDIRHKSLVVSFRGTEQVSWQDFFTDAQMFLQRWMPREDIDLTVSMGNTVGLAEVVPGIVGKYGTVAKVADDAGAVHYGFLRAYMSVRDAVDRGISLLTEGDSEYRLLFTGHSLGGALATVAAGDYAARRGGDVCCISYGAPKVGNFNFARRFNELVPNAFRIVNDSDLVSRMPRSLSTGRAAERYKHSGRTVLVNDFGDFWIEGENYELPVQATKSSIVNPFRERYKDLQELIEHEKQLWEDLLSGISVKHHMEDSYFAAIQQVIRRVAEDIDRHDENRTI